MNTATAQPGTDETGHGKAGDPHHLGRASNGNDATGRGEGGPASKRIIVGYGFWIFLLSDIILFSGFFAAYAVLVGETAGGPTGRELFSLPYVGWETVLLLASSFACGLASIATHKRSMAQTQIWLLVTGLLGAGFLVMEGLEFRHMIAEGAGPHRSAFLSAFFALVGCHGLHVGVGLLWLGTMMAQLRVKGFRPAILRRLLCFNLFWHALDIVWVGLFTIVYLLGAGI
ncbi:cytochrome o ubiquinol oxidase subunit III [Sphingomonas sp. S2-65]|uniref:cytochrome o ubiquinol oxidase subunit III n=1 Tax=Sphingomonas sp. S2-65 TaxID=2903960 RepID=UPI001F265E88|nr:cytochrome o ubiquinol oxidase subunit III [Sphingomonas sp. S2-65]UYY59736.1 cytochrome o ubiquinol oxidase subunit III [Sphingomonas sp. S2-65]